MFAHSVLLLASGQVRGAAGGVESQSIYHFCLRTHLRYLRELNFNGFTVYLRQADYLHLEDGVIDDFHVKFITDPQLSALTEGGRPVTVLQFTPVTYRKGQRSFQVADYTVTRSGREYSTIKGGRSTFKLHLNCETNLFEVEVQGQRRMLSL